MNKFVVDNDKLEQAIQKLTNVATTYESDDDEVIIVCVNEDKVIDDITECINCIYDRKAHSECYDMLHKYKRLIVASIINDRIRTEVVCPVCGVLYTTFVEAQHYKDKDAWRVGDRLVIACFSCESDRKAHKRTTTLFGKPCEYKYVKDASQSDDKGE
jgi:hypothetical protein